MQRRYTYRTLRQTVRFAVPAAVLGTVGYLAVTGQISLRSSVVDIVALPVLAALVQSALGHLIDWAWSYSEV